MGLLEKLLTGRKSGDAADSAPGQNPERLTTREQIGRALTTLAEDRKQVTVTPADAEQDYTSSILNVDTAGGVFELDELHPPAGHQQLAEQRRFRLRTQHKGIDISLKGEVARVDSSAGIAIYTVPFPASVRYLPRRRSYRAELRYSDHIPVFLEFEDGGLLQGELRDVSVGGVGLELLRRPLVPLERGQTAEWCTIRLPDGREIAGSLEIRFISPQPRGGQRTRIGGALRNLRPRDNASLRQLVTAIDRNRIKQRRDR